MGLSALARYFDFALCKDEQLQHFSPELPPAPAYELGHLRVLVGANHLLNEIAANPPDALPSGLINPYRAQLAKIKLGLPATASKYVVADSGGSRWFWYHFGSGHHLVNSNSPNDTERFSYDASWAYVTTAYLDGLIARDLPPRQPVRIRDS